MAILPVNIENLLPRLSTIMYASVRISSFFMISPLFSMVVIPRYQKVIFTFLIGLIISQQIETVHEAPVLFSMTGFLTTITEMCIGTAMGLIIKIIFEILSLTGQNISTSMQLNFATFYSPLDHNDTNIINNLYLTFGMLLFIAIHGPMYLLGALYHSFMAMPIGLSIVHLNQISSLLKFSENMFVYSLLLSLPIVIVLMILHIAMMIFSRISSTLNLFSVGFAISILGGLIMLYLLMPITLHYFQAILMHAFAFMNEWIRMT